MFPSNITVNMLFKLFVLSPPKKKECLYHGAPGINKLETRILPGNLGIFVQP